MKNNTIIKKIIIVLGIIFIITVNVSYARWADLDDESADQISNQEEKNQELIVKENATKSNNNYLASLSVEGYKLIPEFDKQTLNYEINTEIQGDSVKVIATTENEKSKIEGIGDIKLENNENTIKINVIAENGDIRTYSLLIKKIQNTTTENQNIANETTDSKTTIINNKSITYVVIVICIVIVLFVIRKITKKKNRKH